MVGTGTLTLLLLLATAFFDQPKGACGCRGMDCFCNAGMCPCPNAVKPCLKGCSCLLVTDEAKKNLEKHR